MAFTPGHAAVVTGAAGGIGYAVSSHCAALGLRVCLADLNAAALEEARARLVAEIGGQDEMVMAAELDVTSPESYAALVDSVLGRWDGVTVGFVHLNAGVGSGDPRSPGTAAAATLQDWAVNLDVNLIGVVNGVQAFLPLLQSQATPCALAATASWAGLFNSVPYASVPYVVAKHGCVLLMEALCHELRADEAAQVSAHVLCPGQVNTNMLNGIGADRVDRRSEEQQEQAEKRTEFAMQPAEMAQVLVDAVEEGKFYVLGYDDQQPLPWLKEMSTLRTEGIVEERAPLAHLAGDEEASELRQRLRDVRRAASKL